jgi:CDGSH iron-sulfur domain-containing protein 3
MTAIQPDGTATDEEKNEAAPCQAELVEGIVYEWCRCARTKTAPFCDGSHEGTGCGPLRFVAKRTETVNLCGCGETDDPPYCDGTHNII